MTRQRIARGLIALLMASMTGGIAHAEDATTTITATVATLDGVRFINSVPAIVMADLGGGLTLGGELAVTVKEIAKLGSDFSVSAKLAGPFDSTLTATDIPASALSMSTATVVDLSDLLGGGTAGLKESGTLDQTRQIYKVTGQNANNAYSGVYLSTNDLTLTIPEGTRGGAYVATVTITLQNF